MIRDSSTPWGWLIQPALWPWPMGKILKGLTWQASFMTAPNTNIEFITLCEEYCIPITESEYKNPFLLHGKLGAYYAKHKYNVNDEEILSAITWHTTGKPDMPTLEKIIFISDSIEPHRRALPNISAIRKTAFADTDKAMVLISGNILKYLEEEGSSIDNTTRDTYNYYFNLCKEAGKV